MAGERLRVSDHLCAACGHVFATLEQFDRHQQVDYARRPAVRCTAPEALDLVQDTKGTWHTPEGLLSRTSRAARLSEWMQSRGVPR